jgi:Tol biopolymer transport system component/DNA-binding winged helix-turn-helix (wHTH) protein
MAGFRRRRSPHQPSILKTVAKKFRWDDFVLDLDAFRLERNGVPLSLEPKAFNLLVLLSGRPGHVFTKQEIFEQLWPNTVVTDHALTRIVAQLRRVLGDEARESRFIETVPTRGYRWLPAVDSVNNSPVPTAAQDISPSAVARPARLPMVAAVLAMAVVLAGLLGWAQRETKTEMVAASNRLMDVAWPVQLTANPGLDLQPSFSPQGDAVAFASDRSGTFELYVRALKGAATEVPLTHNGQHNVQPAWSPDGSLIAFHSHARGGIWVMPARGGAPQQLAAEGSHPAWSADGRRIAFQSDEPSDVTPSAYGAQSGGTILVVDADGRNQRSITKPGDPLGGHAAPAWSGDGRFVAFSVFEGARNNGVWLVSVDTGATTHLLKGMRGHYELVFAPDDSALYVAGGDAFITRIPFDRQTGATAGEREVVPVPGVEAVRGLTISPDGQRLGFGGLRISSQLWAQPIAADGTGRGEPYALTTDTSRRNSLPVVSPDGSRVAYVSTRGGEPPNVWIVGVDGQNGTQITTSDSPDMLPYWFPDGKRIAFISTRATGMAVWSVDLDTRREQLMLPLGDVASSIESAAKGTVAEPSLSRSMTRLAMSVITPPHANRQIFLSPTAALAPRPVSQASRWVGYPAWSRDESRLAVEIKDGSSTHAGVLDLQSGELRQLTNERGQTWVRSWSPNGKKIAAAAFRNGQWDLRWIDAGSGATGIISPSAAPHNYVRYPSWSPKNDLVVYERGELRGNVWMTRLIDK